MEWPRSWNPPSELADPVERPGLLPIIVVGQNIQAKASDRRAEDTFQDAEAVLKEAEEIQKHLIAQDAAISSILERVQSLTSGPAAKSH